MASAPPSGGARKLHEAEAAVKALTFVVPPSLQGGCGLVKKSRAEMREEGGEGEERRGEEKATGMFRGTKSRKVVLCDPR